MATDEKVLLATASAAADSFVTFLNQFDSTYEEYEVQGINIVPTADGAVSYMQVSVDGGSTWENTAAEYNTEMIFEDEDSLAGTNFATNAAIFLSLDSGKTGRILGNAAGEAHNFTVKLYCPASTAKYKQFMNNTFSLDQSTNLESGITGGHWPDAGAFDSIRFYVTGTTVASGLFKLYGVN